MHNPKYLKRKSILKDHKSIRIIKLRNLQK